MPPESLLCDGRTQSFLLLSSVANLPNIVPSTPQALLAPKSSRFSFTHSRLNDLPTLFLRSQFSQIQLSDHVLIKMLDLNKLDKRASSILRDGGGLPPTPVLSHLRSCPPPNSGPPYKPRHSAQQTALPVPALLNIPTLPTFPYASMLEKGSISQCPQPPAGHCPPVNIPESLFCYSPTSSPSSSTMFPKMWSTDTNPTKCSIE